MLTQKHFMPPDWEGRNRTFNHLFQRQIALPNLRTSHHDLNDLNDLDAEVGFEPTSP